MARALGRDHDDVEIGARLDQVEVDVEAMGEGERGALLHVGCQVLGIELALALVGGDDHDEIGPLGRLGRAHHRQALGLGLSGAARTGAQAHGQVLHAAVLHVQHMGMALAAVADDGDVLGLDQVQIGVTIVKDTHGGFL